MKIDIFVDESALGSAENHKKSWVIEVL